MKKQKGSPVFRRTGIALAVSLMFSAGTAMAGSILITTENANEAGAITDALAAGTPGGTISFANQSFTVNQGFELPGAGVTIDASGNNQTLSGNISGSTGTSNLIIRAGTSQIILSGANTFVGNIDLQSGTLRLFGSATALGSGTLFMGNDTTLLFGSQLTVNNNINASGARFLIDTNGYNASLSGVLNANGDLVKTGAGVLTLGSSSNIGHLIAEGGGIHFNNVAQGLGALTVHDDTTIAGVLNGHIPSLTVAGRETSTKGAAWTGNLNVLPGSALRFDVHSNNLVGGPDSKGTYAMLAVTGDADITEATIHARAGPNLTINIGDEVKFMTVSGNFDHGIQDGDLAQFWAGGLSTIQFELFVGEDGLLTELIGRAIARQATEGAEAATQGILAGLSMLNTQGDLIATLGMLQAKQASAGGNIGTGGFAAIGGGSMKQKTGSHADVDSFSLLAGAAYGSELDTGRMTLGGFIEYGKGSYDTYNAFVRGNGDSWNIGAGVLGRLDFKNSFYTEGSFRLGRLKTGFDSSDLDNVRYDAGSMYYSMHAGLGHILKLDQKSSLDLYGNLFWTHLGSESLQTNHGRELHFDSVDSTRMRLGGRFNYALSETVSSYAGLAYEYEFDGKAHAVHDGDSLKTVSMKGTTGVAELGLSITPSQKKPLTLDLGVRGYTGKREGITGSLRINYRF